MFRDEQALIEPAGVWQPPQTQNATTRAPIADLFTHDETGAVWQLYREIARRIPRNAYTRHASTLADALR
jgi:hypothetical protein